MHERVHTRARPDRPALTTFAGERNRKGRAGSRIRRIVVTGRGAVLPTHADDGSKHRSPLSGEHHMAGLPDVGKEHVSVLVTNPEEARRELAASLVAGIAHDLNGRLAALLGVAHLARSSAPMDDELLSVLDDQIRRLRESVLLLRSVPISDPRAAVREVPLAEAVSAAVRLYRCRSGPELATVHIAQVGEAPAVQVVPPAFTEALLLALAALERPNGRRRVLRIEFGEADRAPFVRIACPEHPDGCDIEEAAMQAAAQRMEVAGGRLCRLADGSLELRFR